MKHLEIDQENDTNICTFYARRTIDTILLKKIIMGDKP